MSAPPADAIDRCQARIWNRLVHPELDLVYDYVGPDDDPRPRFWWLPTGSEIDRRHPNPQGWSTGMEDASLNGGVYLAAMVTAHRVTGEAQYRDKARRLARGLMRTGTSSAEKGYIARALTPDGAHWYPASSVDQYTWWLHGMWRYVCAGIPDATEADGIRDVAEAVCARLERDNWEIKREDN